MARMTSGPIKVWQENGAPPSFTHEKTDERNLSSAFWQGQKDSNPRHAVLEWMWGSHWCATLPARFNHLWAFGLSSLYL